MAIILFVLYLFFMEEKESMCFHKNAFFKVLLDHLRLKLLQKLLKRLLKKRTNYKIKDIKFSFSIQHMLQLIIIQKNKHSMFKELQKWCMEKRMSQVAFFQFALVKISLFLPKKFLGHFFLRLVEEFKIPLLAIRIIMILTMNLYNKYLNFGSV